MNLLSVLLAISWAEAQVAINSAAKVKRIRFIVVNGCFVGNGKVRNIFQTSDILAEIWERLSSSASISSSLKSGFLSCSSMVSMSDW